MKTQLQLAASLFILSAAASLPIGVTLKSRNDAAHVVAMERQAAAQERIAAAAERAYPPKHLVSLIGRLTDDAFANGKAQTCGKAR